MVGRASRLQGPSERSAMTFLRALAVWFGILLLAVANGAFRDLVLAPRLGDTVARAISSLVLCGLVLLVTWNAIVWMRPLTRGVAFRVGATWVALTLTFELLLGHYVRHLSWEALLADYDLTRGRIWILVLITTFGAPAWAARHRLHSRTDTRP